MAPPQCFTPMLLVSLILLYWITSTAQAHDSTPTSLHHPNRFKRELPFRTREQVAASMQTAKEVLSVIKDCLGKTNPETLKGVLKGLSNIFSMAPGIGGLVASIVNVALAFIPQENPMKELKDGFAEVNRRLDSLSVQISNLATDVEWFNYASVYSQDEVRILNAWKKFDEFRENSGLVKTSEEKLRLAETFTNYYENTAVEASVANLYHYLTVSSSTSLVGNLNDLLRKKFKCGTTEIGKYNIYFFSLLWRGMVLNQFYWNLIGFNPGTKEALQTQMMKNVYEIQVSAVKFCLDNYNKYMEEDVKEISKSMSPDNKTAIAMVVKDALDKKYNWYNWVVLVYNTDEKENYMLFELKAIYENKVTVAVGHTPKAKELLKFPLRDLANDCFVKKQCSEAPERKKYCATEYTVAGEKLVLRLTDFVKVTHVAYGFEFKLLPDPFLKTYCDWGSKLLGENNNRISMYYSQRLSVCTEQECENGGHCQRLLDSNESVCECQEGYYGDNCEKKVKIWRNTDSDLKYPVPDISTLNIKLDKMESKLQAILDKLNAQCPRY